MTGDDALDLSDAYDDLHSYLDILTDAGVISNLNTRNYSAKMNAERSNEIVSEGHTKEPAP